MLQLKLSRLDQQHPLMLSLTLLLKRLLRHNVTIQAEVFQTYLGSVWLHEACAWPKRVVFRYRRLGCWVDLAECVWPRS